MIRNKVVPQSYLAWSWDILLKTKRRHNFCTKHRKETINTHCPKLVQEITIWKVLVLIRFFRTSSIKASIRNLLWPTLNMAHVDVHFDNVGQAGQLSTKTVQDEKIKNSMVWRHNYRNYGKCDLLACLNKGINCFRDFFTVSWMGEFLKRFLSLFKHSNLLDFFWGGGQIIVSMRICSFHRFYVTWTNFWCTNLISAEKSCV